jgi:hypothetical protein
MCCLSSRASSRPGGEGGCVGAVHEGGEGSCVEGGVQARWRGRLCGRRPGKRRGRLRRCRRAVARASAWVPSREVTVLAAGVRRGRAVAMQEAGFGGGDRGLQSVSFFSFDLICG